MNRMEQTRALRADQAVHYNCCQSVLVPFAKAAQIKARWAMDLLEGIRRVPWIWEG